MKELLLVGVGVMGQPYLEAAARLGVPVRAVEAAGPGRDRSGAGPGVPGHVSFHMVPPGPEESWLPGIEEALAQRVPDGIVGFAEPQVIPAALVQERLGLPGPSLQAAVISRNKALQRAVCAARGVPQPQYLLAPDIGTARDWMLDRLPVVVKPLTLSGSEGVELVRDPAAVADITTRRAGEGTVLVERAVEGPEYSWEALVRDGAVLFENITAKETTPPPYFVELSHRCGHAFTEPGLADRVRALTRGVLAAIGMRTGLVHLEFRVGPDGPALMEVAVRTPGDYLADAVGLAHGFDLYEASVRLSLGLPLEGRARPGGAPRTWTATCFLTAPPGRVTAVEGLEQVRKHPGVVRARLRRGIGDTVGPLTSSAQRVGHVLISAGTREEREDTMKFVRETLLLRTATGPENG
ncbi:ATP-grasp domain-containing protein [Streptomyces sodiiphilus]|uniref:ATP-grasp domain-containing protein n=1 Tax=Streptomyces sodiiphilus TaxID=226217 RepID=A0ABP5A4T7_9ACTN